MGIWPKSNPSTAYVPPQSETNQTLLGEGRLPASNLNDDLNRSPATSAELRFRHVVLDGHDTGFDHAYMVITDNHMGEQRIHQAGPLGPRRLIPYPLGTIEAGTDKYGPAMTGFDQPYRWVAIFHTDAPSEKVQQALDGFGAAFNKKAIPYALPDVRIPFMPANPHPWFPTPNSNLYGGAAWQFLTGSLPDLPAGVDAPGWGDHGLPNSPLK